VCVPRSPPSRVRSRRVRIEMHDKRRQNGAFQSRCGQTCGSVARFAAMATRRRRPSCRRARVRCSRSRSARRCSW
jgi:hypothetical protein